MTLLKNLFRSQLSYLKRPPLMTAQCGLARQVVSLKRFDLYR